MSEEFFIIFTNVGIAKEAAYIANGTRYNPTQIAVGDSNGSYYNPTGAETALVNEVWRGDLNNLYQDPNDASQFIAEGVVPDSAGPFWVREIGIFDEVGDLIAIGKYPERYKPAPAQGASSSIYIKGVFKVSVADAVNITINPSAIMATQAYVDNAVTLHDVDPAAHYDVTQTTRGFMRPEDKLKLDTLNQSGVTAYSVNSGNTDANGYADIVERVSDTEVSFKVGGAYPNLGVTFPNGKRYEIAEIPNVTGLDTNAKYTFVVFEESIIPLGNGVHRAIAAAVKISYSFMDKTPDFSEGSLPGYSAIYASGVALNPYYLVDGNTSTYFSYGGNNASTAGAGAIINFPSVLNIKKLTLNNYNIGYAFDSGSGSYCSPSVYVYFSSDGGTTWSAPTTKNLSGGGVLNILEFPVTQANSIKLHFNAGYASGSNGNYSVHSAGVSINNLSIFHEVSYLGGAITEDIKYPEVPTDGDLALLINQKPLKPYLRQGGAWVSKQFIKLGEATKSGGVILPADVISYAFNGIFYKALSCPSVNSITDIQANISSDKVKISSYLINKSSELGYSAGMKARFAQYSSDRLLDPWIIKNKNIISVVSGNGNFCVVQYQSPYVYAQVTPAKWDIEITAERSF